MGKIAEFEQDISKLETILDELQQQDVTLENSLQMYAQAAKLVAKCNDTLNTAKLQIDEITASLQTDKDD